MMRFNLNGFGGIFPDKARKDVSTHGMDVVFFLGFGKLNII
jgi:hypothetical protein